MNVSSAAVLEVRVGLVVVGSRMGSVVCGVAMSGQVHDVLDGFTRAGAQHQGRDGEKDDEHSLGHWLRSFRQLPGGVKGARRGRFDKQGSALPFGSRPGTLCLPTHLQRTLTMAAPNLPNILRIVAVWLLTMCVCFGPGKFGASVALAAAKACEGGCPCSQAEVHAEHEPCADETEAGSHYQPSDPCHSDCSDSCPTCACRLGAALAVLSLPTTAHPAAWSFTSLFASVDAVTCGPCTRVFRPPRALG